MIHFDEYFSDGLNPPTRIGFSKRNPCHLSLKKYENIFIMMIIDIQLNRGYEV